MSLHAEALATLRGWSPTAPAQLTLRDRYVAHLEQHPDGTDRACHPGHLTAGALVLDATGDHVLLNLHRKAGRWFHFGGHCEPGDPNLAAVALREAREESGLDDLRLHPVPLHLDEHVVDFCGPRDGVHHLDVRFGAVAPTSRSRGGPEPRASDESLAVRWWPVDDLPDLEEEMHVLIGLVRAHLRQGRSTSVPGGSATRAAADQPRR